MKQFGLPLFELLDSLHRIDDSGPFAALTAAEYLELSPQQAIIVSTPAGAYPNSTQVQALKLAWGLLPTETIAALSDLEFALHKSGLEQGPFEDVLAVEL